MTRKLEVARSVAAKLYAAEDAIDAAIRETAQLTVAITDARLDLNLAAVVGGEVFDHAAALQGRLASARTQAVELHGSLAEVRDRLRIRMDEPGFGNPDKPPMGIAAVEARLEPRLEPRLELRADDEPRRLRTA